MYANVLLPLPSLYHVAALRSPFQVARVQGQVPVKLFVLGVAEVLLSSLPPPSPPTPSTRPARGWEDKGFAWEQAQQNIELAVLWGR